MLAKCSEFQYISNAEDLIIIAWINWKQEYDFLFVFVCGIFCLVGCFFNLNVTRQRPKNK